MSRRSVVLELFDRCCVLGVTSIPNDATLLRHAPSEWRQTADLLRAAGEVERAEVLSRLWAKSPQTSGAPADEGLPLETSSLSRPSTGLSPRRRSIAAVRSPLEQLVEQSRVAGHWQAAVSALLQSSPRLWSPRMLRDAVTASAEGSSDWRVACQLAALAPTLPLDDASLRCILRTVRRSAQWSIGFAVLKRYDDHHQLPSSRAYSDLCWSVYVHASWEVALRVASSVTLPSFYVGMAQVGSLIRGGQWCDALHHLRAVVPGLPGASQPFPSAMVILFLCVTALKVDPTGACSQRILEYCALGLPMGSKEHAAVVAAALCGGPSFTADSELTTTTVAVDLRLESVPLRSLVRCAAVVCSLLRSHGYPSLSHVSGLLKGPTCRCTSVVSYRLGRAAATSSLSAAGEAELLTCVGEEADTTAFFRGFLLAPSADRTSSKR